MKMPLVLLMFGIGMLYAQVPLNRKAVDTYEVAMSDPFRSIFTYGYAPSIIYDNGKLHCFFCSPDSTPGVPWDMISYTSSSDMGKTWTAPSTALLVSDNFGERAACDPNIIRWPVNDPSALYYMYYTGHHQTEAGKVFVARATNIEGPYEKYVGNNQWSSSPAAIPYPIIHATTPLVGDDQYGAGQSTAIVLADNTILLWHADTSLNPVKNPWQWIRRIGSNPWTFDGGALVSGMRGPSYEVKYDINNARLVAVKIELESLKQARLTRQFSTDLGLGWTNEETICDDSTCMPDYTHNPGVASDYYGNLLPGIYGALPDLEGKSLVGYGGPVDLIYTADSSPVRDPNWGHWDLYMSRFDLRGGAPCTPGSTAPIMSPVNATANSQLPGWEAIRLTDGDPNTVFSSYPNPSSTNTSGFHAAVWFDQGPQAVDLIRLHPRILTLISPTGVQARLPYFFPKTYHVYVTNPENTQWNYLGLFDHQPANAGGYPVTFSADINLSNPILTHGILIVPDELRDEGTGSFYFQMADIDVHAFRICQ